MRIDAEVTILDQAVDHLVNLGVPDAPAAMEHRADGTENLLAVDGPQLVQAIAHITLFAKHRHHWAGRSLFLLRYLLRGLWAHDLGQGGILGSRHLNNNRTGGC
ncbi:MAG: hypothetical protein AB3N33_03805 [Puniceicoccaceae bacterium]